jgi:hypothetical protein
LGTGRCNDDDNNIPDRREKEPKMKMWNKTRQWRLIGAALAVALTASCAPVMEPTDLEKAEKESGHRTGTYLTLKPVEVPRPAGAARSMTAEQQESFWNFYEVIVKKTAYRYGSLTGDPYYSMQGKRSANGAAVSVDVEENYRYDVLLLEGFKDDKGGDPVLIRTAFARTDWITTGENIAEITRQQILVSPSNNDDEFAGMRIYLTAEDNTIPRRPAYVGGVLSLGLERHDPAAEYLGNAQATMAIDGITPLILAKNAASGNSRSEQLTDVLFSDFFASGTLTRAALISTYNGWAYNEWKGGAKADVDIGDIDGRALITWDLNDMTRPTGWNRFLLPVDASTPLYFDLKYYGFSETPVTDTATAKFIPWTIRNGLNNDQSDKESGVNDNGNIGGLITAVFGNGWSIGDTLNLGDPANPDNANLFRRSPSIQQVKVKINGEIEYNITPSDPPADRYTLYWTEETEQSVGRPLEDWSKEENIPANTGRSVMLSGAVNGRYRLAVTAEKTGYRSANSVKSLDTYSRINIAGGVTSGMGWSYDAASRVYTLFESDRIYRIYSTYDVSFARSIQTAAGLTNVIIRMGDAGGDPINKPINITSISSKPLLQIGAGSAVTVELCDGMESKLEAANGAPAIQVADGAALTINGAGKLYVSGAANRSAVSGGQVTLSGRVALALNNGAAFEGSTVLLDGGEIEVTGTLPADPFAASAQGSRWKNGMVRIGANITVYNDGPLDLPAVLFSAAAPDTLTIAPGNSLIFSGLSTAHNGAVMPGVTLTVPAGKTVVNNGVFEVYGPLNVSGGGTVDNAAGWIAAESVPGSVTGGVVFENNEGSLRANTTLTFIPVVKPAQRLTVAADRMLTVQNSGGRKLVNTGVITLYGQISVSFGTVVNDNGIIYNERFHNPSSPAFVDNTLVNGGIMFSSYKASGDVTVTSGNVNSSITLGAGQVLRIPADVRLNLGGDTLTAGPGSSIIGESQTSEIWSADLRAGLDLGGITLGGSGTIDFTGGGTLTPDVNRGTTTPGGQYGSWTVKKQ